MLLSRSRILAPVAAPAAGATFGALAPLLGTVGNPAGHAAHLVLSAGWAWAALAFCVGLTRRSKAESVLLAAATLLVAVLAYYLVKLGQGEYLTADLNDPSGGTGQVSWGSFLSKTFVWGLAACLAGPALGWAGNMARNSGFRGLPFRLLVPLIALIESTQRLRVEAALQGAVAGTTWNAVRLVAAAVIIALVAHTLLTRRPRTSTGRARE
ncbi:hypothetical protein AB0F18_24195 [Streptomyces sp. NPDC029216]|uniref:hypothetical protein n=1 Tax=Streptomyces sp. NPDC029216 TaxID=3154701 RepID=UPI0033F2022B